MPALAENLPALAEKCMAVKGLKYKDTWEDWSPSQVAFRNGDSWIFDLKKPDEVLILASGECGPMTPVDVSIFRGHDNCVTAKLRKKREDLGIPHDGFGSS